jgi:hypothetical protein
MRVHKPDRKSCAHERHQRADKKYRAETGRACSPSRRQSSPAFSLLADALRYRFKGLDSRRTGRGVAQLAEQLGFQGGELARRLPSDMSAGIVYVRAR